jgi:hypothetical protein
MTTGIAVEKKKRSDKLSSARAFLVGMTKHFDCVDQIMPCLHQTSIKILLYVCQSQDPLAVHLKKSSSFGLIVPIISMVSTIDLD